MSPNNFSEGHLVKTKWLLADATAVGSFDRAERAILGLIVAGRGVVAEPLCDVGTSS